MNPASKLARKVLCKLGLAPVVLKVAAAPPTILMFHGVSLEPRSGLHDADGKHVDAALFRQQLAALARHFNVVSLTELVRRVVAGESTRSLVAITFDDGYLNNVECAAPILKEMGMPATFFLASGFIGVERWAWTDRLEAALDRTIQDSVELPQTAERVSVNGFQERRVALSRVKRVLKSLDWSAAEAQVAAIESSLGVEPRAPWGVYRFMTWEHTRQLVDNGFEVGAHTVNHAILSRVDIAVAEREIVDSRERIASETGQCSPVFCYPNGKRADYTPAVMDVCRKHFTAAVSANSGSAEAHELFELRRIAVDNGTSAQRLTAALLQAG